MCATFFIFLQNPKKQKIEKTLCFLTNQSASQNFCSFTYFAFFRDDCVMAAFQNQANDDVCMDGADEMNQSKAAIIHGTESDGYTLLHIALTEPSLESMAFIRNLLSGPLETAFDDVFIADTNSYSVTPFLLACSIGYDNFIMRFLALIDGNPARESIPIRIFADKYGNNVFHHILQTAAYQTLAEQMTTISAMINKIPHIGQLINAKNTGSGCPVTPLDAYLRCCILLDKPVLIDLVKLFLAHEASKELIENEGRKLLHRAILTRYVDLVEIMLRAGCPLDVTEKNPNTALCYALKGRQYERPSIRILELLLAFGIDLQKELFLDDLSFEKSPEYAKSCGKSDELISLRRTGYNLQALLDGRDIHKIDQDVLKALRDLCESNKMLSLQRLCRNKIRRHLKGKADLIIRNLMEFEISKTMKAFLLVENEPAVLGILE